MALARIRQNTRWDGYKCIGDYHDGVYECDFVSPYTKSAGRLNADVMVILQDWWSDEGMNGPIDEDSVELGYGRSSATNRNLISLLDATFGLALEAVYVTNLFPFIKPGNISAGIPRRDLVAAARQFALPQVHIVKPMLVICLGLATFNAIREACGLRPCPNLDGAIASPFDVGRTRVWGQAHTAMRGQNARSSVSDDWLRMKKNVRARSAKGKPRSRGETRGGPGLADQRPDSGAIAR